MKGREFLAHYSQVSTDAKVGLSTPPTLSTVFDHFVADTSLLHDSLMMETAGSQCLLLAGFFSRAASLEQASQDKARLLDSIARGFEPWRQRYARLSRDFREQPYLLRNN